MLPQRPLVSGMVPPVYLAPHKRFQMRLRFQVMQQSSMHGYTLTRAVTSKMDMEFHGQVKMSRGISHQANSQTLWSVNSRERCH